MKNTPLSPSLSFFALLIPFVLLGCGELKKLDEMNQNTGEMNDTTKSMTAKTESMDEKMSEMKGLTRELLDLSKKDLSPTTGRLSETSTLILDDGRQGAASGLRREALEKILAATSSQARLVEAVLYVGSFEHQLLSDLDYDAAPERRLLLYQQTLAEFFARLDEFAPRKGRVWPDAKPDTSEIRSEENRAAAYNAISLAIGKNNRKQVPDETYGQPMSIYDLIIVALKAKADIDSGRLVLPAGAHFIKEVLSRPAQVNQLLQTRYNMFALALVSMTTDFTEQGMMGQLSRLANRFSVDLSEKTLGVARQTYLREEILEPAAQVARDMTALGLKPKLTFTTSLVVERMDVGPLPAQMLNNSNDQKTVALWQAYRNP